MHLYITPNKQPRLSGVIMKVLKPADSINDHCHQHDTGGVTAGGIVKPVVTIDQMHLVAVRRHIAAPFRQTDEVPETPGVKRKIAIKEVVHLHFGRQKIITEQMRQ